jgi:hypothetical protein
VRFRRISKVTWCLIVLTSVSYLLSWTGVAVGLVIFGMAFEALSFVSSMRDDRLQRDREDAEFEGPRGRR